MDACIFDDEKPAAEEEMICSPFTRSYHMPCRSSFTFSIYSTLGNGNSGGNGNGNGNSGGNNQEEEETVEEEEGEEEETTGGGGNGTYRSAYLGVLCRTPSHIHLHVKVAHMFQT